MHARHIAQHTPQFKFLSAIPLRPYCNDHHGRLFVRPRDQAVKRRHISLDGPMSLNFMSFDVDKPDSAFAYEDAGLPHPAFVAVNPENGHSHVAWQLDTPVLRFPESSTKALRFFADVERGFQRRLGADPAYNGLLIKNPLHPAWRTLWLSQRPYGLAELNDYLNPIDKRRPVQVEQEIGAGRNVSVFEQGRRLAYKAATRHLAAGLGEAFEREVLAICFSLNVFAAPLRISEVRGIAKSIAKFVRRRFSAGEFSQIQRSRVAKRWQGHDKTAAKPWKLAGISRATWFRRKAKLVECDDH